MSAERGRRGYPCYIFTTLLRNSAKAFLTAILALCMTEAFAFGEGDLPPLPAPEASKPAPVPEGILNLDIEQLGKVPVKVSPPSRTAPSNYVSGDTATSGDVGTTTALLSQMPSVTYRRTSALNLDPSVRGYHSSQLNASANGITQLKTRVDIDSLYSQIDPGVVQNATVIDGPYSSLYGPGFAFLLADLLPPPRFDTPETHLESTFVFGSNSQSIYNRDNILSGGKDWGMLFSYGVRTANDYFPGGGEPSVPSSYKKWDGLFTISRDLAPQSRVEFDYLRTDINDMQLPGIIYDIDNSKNDQFNCRYVIQEDRKGPEQSVLQSWWNQTYYRGNALRPAKQETFYHPFATLPTFALQDVNSDAEGNLNSLGVRALRTLGKRDGVQWTLGADWRRYGQSYQERDLTPDGQLAYGKVFGIPSSRMDDVGVLTDLFLPVSDEFSVNIGGRIDYAQATLDVNDPVITEVSSPADFYYSPGFVKPSYALGMAYVSGSYRLTDAYTVKLGSGYAMRPPDLNELYVNDPFSPITRFGNSYASGFSNMAPERDLQFDLGVAYQTKKLSYGVRGFYSFIWGYIEPVPAFVTGEFPASATPSHTLGRDFRDFPPIWRTDFPPFENDDRCQAGYQFVNLDLATLLGGDMFTEAKLSDRFAVFGTMSYVCGTNQSPMAFVQTQVFQSLNGEIVRYGGTDGLAGIYPLNGTVGFRFTAPEEDRWLVEFSSRLVAPQENVASVLAELPSPGFAVFDLRGYCRLRKNVRLTLDLQNLFNCDYAEPGSLIYMDRSGQITPIKEPGFTALAGVDFLKAAGGRLLVTQNGAVR